MHGAGGSDLFHGQQGQAQLIAFPGAGGRRNVTFPFAQRAPAGSGGCQPTDGKKSPRVLHPVRQIPWKGAFKALHYH